MGRHAESILKTGLKPKPVKDNAAFTLMEVLLAVAILSFCLCGMLLAYVDMLLLTDQSRNFTLAVNSMQAKIEEIKNTPFSGLSALNETTFTVDGIDSSRAIGAIQVSDFGYSDMKRVRLEVSLKLRNRLIGEDKNLHGRLDIGEDTIIDNGQLDSPIELVTLISQ